MDLGDSELLKKRAWRILALVVVIIVVLFIISLIFKVVLIPSLIGTILVICIVAYVAHRIYVSKRQGMSPDVEGGRT